jgi:hypothetical protein
LQYGITGVGFRRERPAETQSLRRRGI